MNKETLLMEIREVLKGYHKRGSLGSASFPAAGRSHDMSPHHF
jgi:hypothetical protein